MSTLQLDHVYEGPFDCIGTSPTGAPIFSSMQVLEDSSGIQSGLEVNAVNWSVEQDGRLTGTAKFLTLATHDVVNAVLEGTSPVPPPGQDFREAFVTVRFTGGSRSYQKAAGEGRVEAKLYNNGISRGTIRGVIQIPDYEE